MKHNHLPLLAVVVLALGGCRKGDDAGGAPGWELKPPAPDTKPVQATGKLPGIYPAGSRIKDRDALDGFGPCDNYPWDLAGKKWGTVGAVSIIAFPEEPVAYFKHRGFALRVVNRWAETVPFGAGGSALSIVREAQDGSGFGGRSRRPHRRSAGTASTECFSVLGSTGNSRPATTPARRRPGCGSGSTPGVVGPPSTPMRSRVA